MKFKILDVLDSVMWVTAIAAVGFAVALALGCASGTYSVTPNQIIIHRSAEGPVWVDSDLRAVVATFHNDGTTATLMTFESITDADLSESKGGFESFIDWLGKIGYAAVGFLLGGG